MKSGPLLAALGLLYTSSLLAEQEEALQPALFNLSLEELMGIEVTVASRIPQSLINIPSNVTLISEAQLRRWNVSSLWELMGRIPGVLPLVDRDQKVIGVRGAVSGNTRGVLVLINGQPFYDSHAIAGRGIESQTLDLDLVEQVEVLRGPGGLIWHGNPLLAVINLKMKKASERGGELHAFVGTEGTYGASFIAGLKKEKWHWDVDASIYASDGLDVVSETSINPANDRLRLLSSNNTQNPPFGSAQFRLDQFEPSYSVWTEIATEDFRLQGFFMHFLGTSRQLEVGQGRRLMEELNRGVVSSSYDWSVKQGGELNASFTYSQHDMDWYAHSSSEPTISNLWRSKQWNYSLNYSSHWEGGRLLLALDYIDGDLGPLKLFNPGDANDIVPVSSSQVLSALPLEQYSFAVQYHKNLDKGLELQLGAKWNRSRQGEIERSNIDPQIAAIWSPSATRVFKLTYNQSSLRPDAEQVRQGLNEETPDQTVGSLDAIWQEQIGENWTTSLTLYQQDLNDRVMQREVNGIKSYGTIGDVRSRGMELEGTGKLGRMELWGNMTYTHVKSQGGAPQGTAADTLRFDESGQGLAFPEWMANLGVSFSYGNFSFSPALRYLGSVRIRTLSSKDSPEGRAIYKDLSADIQLDININYKLSPKASVSFYGSNLFNETTPLPATVFNGVTEPYGRFMRLEFTHEF